MQEECHFVPKTNPNSKKILQKAQEPPAPIPESRKNPYNQKAVEEA